MKKAPRDKRSRMWELEILFGPAAEIEAKCQGASRRLTDAEFHALIGEIRALKGFPYNSVLQLVGSLALEALARHVRIESLPAAAKGEKP
jgi:hypothetical protein